MNVIKTCLIISTNYGIDIQQKTKYTDYLQRHLIFYQPRTGTMTTSEVQREAIDERK